MSVARLFLTGQPGCGKTTAIRRVFATLESRRVKAGGMISGEIRKSGVRVGFSLEDMATRATGILAHIELKDGPSVGKYRVNLGDLDTIGASAIRRAVMDTSVVIVDEIGPMELHSKPFVEAVEFALASRKALLGTLHWRASHPLVTSIRSDPNHEIIELTLQNREQLPERIVERLTSHA